MYEIPFISKTVLDPEQETRAKNQTARMVAMTTIANKLTTAGWRIEWTVTGLAFELPYKLKYGGGWERTPDAIRQVLAGMGIEEKVREKCARSLLEVVVAQREYEDRVWYAEAEHESRLYGSVDHNDYDLDGYLFLQQKLGEMLLMEEAYNRKELIVEGDYERGTVKGRQQALDWLLGEALPAVQPEDPLTAEGDEEDRASCRAEDAVALLYETLFEEQEPRTPDSSQADVSKSDAAEAASTPTGWTRPSAGEAVANGTVQGSE